MLTDQHASVDAQRVCLDKSGFHCGQQSALPIQVLETGLPLHPFRLTKYNRNPHSIKQSFFLLSISIALVFAIRAHEGILFLQVPGLR